MKGYLFIGLAALILCGCLFQQPPAKTSTNETTPQANLTGCGAISNSTAGDLCYYNEALLKSNLTECSLVLSNSLRDQCIYAFAVSRNDTSLCSELSNVSKQNECYLGLSATAGVAACDKMASESSKMQCYLNLGNYSLACGGVAGYNYSLCVALAGNSPSSCGSLSNASLADQCYLTFSENKSNPAGCGSISSSDTRDSCYGSIASETMNQSLCNNITFNYSRQLCLARLVGTEAYCDALTDYLQRDSCIKEFAVEKLDEVKCNEISTNIYRDVCIQQIAAAKGEQSICSMITCYACIEDKDSCYMGVALSTKLVAPCAQVSDPLKKNQCVMDTAQASVNASQCGLMQNGYSLEYCYSLIINSNSIYDPATCDGVTQQSWRDECYKKAAQSTNNSVWCDKVQDAFVKDACLKQF